MIAGASSSAPARGLVTPGTRALSRCSWSGRSSPGPLRAPRFEIFTWGGPPACGGRSVWRCTAGGGATPTCPEGTGRGGRREPGRHRRPHGSPSAADVLTGQEGCVLLGHVIDVLCPPFGVLEYDGIFVLGGEYVEFLLGGVVVWLDVWIGWILHRELSQRLLLGILRSEGDEPHGCVLVGGALGYQEVRPAHDYLVPDHRPGSFRLQGMQCPCLPGERHVRGAVDHRLFYLAVCGGESCHILDRVEFA